MKCDTCKHKEDFFACDVCIHEPCLKDQYEPITNGDRIRSMSDEELAEFLSDISHCCEYAYSGVCFRCPHTWCNSTDTEKWLKQPNEI